MKLSYKSLAFLVIIILLTGCGSSASPTPPGLVHREETVTLPTTAPPPEPSPSNTRVLSAEMLTPEPTPTITPIPDETRGLVVEVIDGDTIAVVMEGDPTSLAYEVRYIGIDAPPTDDPWGMVAYETNRKMINLKIVRLVRDQTDFDDEGRLLRYVYLGDELMSLILAERGLARADTVEPNTRFQTDINEAESRAKRERLGLWGPPPTSTPPRSQVTPVETEEPTESETVPPTAATTEPATTEPEETTEPTTESSPDSNNEGQESP